MKSYLPLIGSLLLINSAQANEWQAVHETDPITDEVTSFAQIQEANCDSKCRTLTYTPVISDGMNINLNCFDVDFKEPLKKLNLRTMSVPNVIYRIDKQKPVTIRLTDIPNKTSYRLCNPNLDMKQEVALGLGVLEGKEKIVFRAQSIKGDDVTVVFNLAGARQAILKANPEYQEQLMYTKERLPQ